MSGKLTLAAQLNAMAFAHHALRPATHAENVEYAERWLRWYRKTGQRKLAAGFERLLAELMAEEQHDPTRA